jgi:hypothetical protein
MIVPQEILSAVDENAMSSRRQISMRTKRQESIFNQKNILSLKENISHDNVIGIYTNINQEVDETRAQLQ